MGSAHLLCKTMCSVWNEKDENRKRDSWTFFDSVFILCLKYLMTWMITKRLNGYVPYLYTWIKYKSITVYIKSKTGGGD